MTAGLGLPQSHAFDPRTHCVRWLGKNPNPGTIYKDVVDMMASRQVWESFNTIVGSAPDRACKYGTFHSWLNSSYARM
jgi:hypothetical protein